MRDAVLEQISFQRWLDETFPSSVRVLYIIDVEERMIPSFGIVTGRLFCLQATLVPVTGEWAYRVMADPNVPGTAPDDMQMPFSFWTEGFHQVEGVSHVLLETPIIDPLTGEEDPDVVRVLHGFGGEVVLDAEGNAITPERMREWTSRREIEFFPQGLEVAVSGDGAG